MNTVLQISDPEVDTIIKNEQKRQHQSICLIPSENFTSKAVLEALGSVMSNKYSEGYVGARYYGGNENIDAIEELCQRRALEAFHLDPEVWGVNVQALSGSPANFYVYTALMGPHGRLMALDLTHGGHLSHGFETSKKKISATSLYFESFPYFLDESTGLIDYETLDKNAHIYRPKIIVAGTSAYSRLIDYQALRKTANSVGAYLLADMAHISGLVSSQVIPSPFEYADVVTTTTHKSLRGPRGALIFYRKDARELGKKINEAVFPGHQGGPHNHSITALAVALKQACSNDFVMYQKQVLKNASILASTLMKLGYKIVSNGTDTHLMLLDLSPFMIDGSRVEYVLEMVNIAVNKNTIPGDKSALTPSGLRIGTPAMTTRGLKEEHMIQIAEFIHKGIQLALKIKNDYTNADEKKEKLSEYKSRVCSNQYSELHTLKSEVIEFASQFETIGF